jgi:hypothetical protein
MLTISSIAYYVKHHPAGLAFPPPPLTLVPASHLISYLMRDGLNPASGSAPECRGRRRP